MKCAIYCRVSTADQNCQRQKDELIAYAARQSWQVLGTFTETASGGKNDRTERQRIIELAQRGKVDVVLVSELSRWGRSTSDLLKTLHDLTGWKVSLIALNGLQVDMTSSTGKLMVTILAGVSQFERELLGERVRSGLEAARRRGRVGGRPPGLSNKLRRKREEVLRLKREKLSLRQISRLAGIAPNSVKKLLAEAEPKPAR